MEPQRTQPPVNGAAALGVQPTSLTALLGGAQGPGQSNPFPAHQLASMFPTHGVGQMPGPGGAAFRPMPGGTAQFFSAAQPMLSQSPPPRKGGSGGPPRSGAASGKKQCNCKNSRCLKLYCECFASGRYCESCNCVTCLNNRENEATRQSAVEAILERNPNAFRPKIQGSEAEVAAARSAAAADGLAPRHTKGCNCKKSTCLKKYCECFQAAIYCSDMCKCVDCKNYEGSEARAQVMAVTEVGGAAPVPFGRGDLGLASPSKRPRSQQGMALGPAGPSGLRPPGLAGLLPGSQGQQLQQLLAGPGPGSLRMGLTTQSRQSAFQQVLSELVPTSMIEDLCRLLFMAADSEQQRLQQKAEAAGGGELQNGTGEDGGSSKEGAYNSERLYEAQERAVLEEFSSIFGKIVESAVARCTTPSAETQGQLTLGEQVVGPTPGTGPVTAAGAGFAGLGVGPSTTPLPNLGLGLGQQGLGLGLGQQGMGLGQQGLNLTLPGLGQLQPQGTTGSLLPGQGSTPAGGAGSSAASIAATVAAVAALGMAGLGTSGFGGAGATPSVRPGFTLPNTAAFGAALPSALGQGQTQPPGSNPYLAAAAAAAAMMQAMQAGAGQAQPSQQQPSQGQHVMQLSQQQTSLQQQQQQAINQLHAAFALRQQQQQQRQQQQGQSQGPTASTNGQ